MKVPRTFLRHLPAVAAFILVVAGALPTVAQTDFDEQIRKLEEALELIKAEAQAGKDVAAQIQALQDELAELKQQMAAADTAGTVPDADAQGTSGPDGDQADVARAGVDSHRRPLAAEGRTDPYDDPDFKKSTPLFGSDWRLGFGGYAKVDLLHDFSGTGDKRQLVLATIPVDGNPSTGSYTNLQINETRMHIEMRNTKSKKAKGRFYVEWDFFGDVNPLSFRLRHAYFEYGRLMGGRNWTLLTELRQLPLILDFAAGDSLLGGRTEMIRWTTVSQDRQFGWAVALENFNDGAIDNPTDRDGVARSNFPRLTAGLTKHWSRGLWSTGAAVTQLRFDGAEGVSDSSEAAWTVTTAGRVYLDKSKQHWLGLGVGYASGSVDDIITYANGGVPNAAVDSEGQLDVARGWNAQFGLHWKWSEALSSNANYTYATLTDVPELFDPDFIRTGSSVHANLIYQHNEQITGGLEVMHGSRENVSGRDGDAFRLQLSLFYYF